MTPPLFWVDPRSTSVTDLAAAHATPRACVRGDHPPTRRHRTNIAPAHVLVGGRGVRAHYIFGPLTNKAPRQFPSSALLMEGWRHSEFVAQSQWNATGVPSVPFAF